MPSIDIPKVHIPGVKGISELSEENINLVYDFLKKQPDGIGISKFISSFVEQIGDEKIGGAIYSFGQLLSYRHTDIKEISDNLIDSYIEIANDKLDEAMRDKLNERLFNILSLSAFLIVSNEAYNTISNFNSITRTDISTDVRLLFGNSNFKKRNALLLHKLFIRYRHKDEFVSEIFYLDNNDLIELKSQIEESLAYEEDIRKNNDDVLGFIELS